MTTPIVPGAQSTVVAYLRYMFLLVFGFILGAICPRDPVVAGALNIYGLTITLPPALTTQGLPLALAAIAGGALYSLALVKFSPGELDYKAMQQLVSEVTKNALAVARATELAGRLDTARAVLAAFVNEAEDTLHQDGNLTKTRLIPIGQGLIRLRELLRHIEEALKNDVHSA